MKKMRSTRLQVSFIVAVMAILLCIAVPALCATYTKDVKSYGGAIGNGTTDDTTAIQNTINAVNTYITSHSGYTGVVTFPAGTYKVSVSGTAPQRMALRVYKNITLKGVTVSDAINVTSIIKLANNQGNFDAIIAGSDYTTDLSNFTMKYMGVDENGDNNTVTGQSQLDAGFRYGVRVFVGSGMDIEYCKFMNFRCVNITTFNGTGVSNGKVMYCYFGGTGGNSSSFDYDHSSVYTQGSTMTVSNNTFYSRDGVGTWGARTAIELHGDSQTCVSNFINNYTTAINATGVAYSSNTSLYQYNYVNGAYLGILIWSLYVDGNTSNPALTNCTVCDNTININVDGWKSLPISGGGYSNGIALFDSIDSQAPNAKIDGLYILRNTINYSNNVNATYDESYYAGIMMSQVSVQPLLSNVTISGNTINNAPAAGMFINCNAYNWAVNGNTIVNAGSSPNTGMWSGFRSGMMVYGSTNGIWITPNNPPYPGNDFKDSRTPIKMVYCLCAGNNVTGVAQFLGNTQSTNSGIPWFSRNGGTGTWDHQ